MKKKKLYFIPIKPDVETYSLRTRYTSDSDTPETDMCAQNCQVAASTIWAIRPSSESTGDV